MILPNESVTSSPCASARFIQGAEKFMCAVEMAIGYGWKHCWWSGDDAPQLFESRRDATQAMKEHIGNCRTLPTTWHISALLGSIASREGSIWQTGKLPNIRSSGR
jgi:hypothetical protein